MNKNVKVKVTLTVRPEQAEWLRREQRIGNLEYIFDAIIRIREESQKKLSELYDLVLNGETEEIKMEASIQYLRQMRAENDEYRELREEKIA